MIKHGSRGRRAVATAGIAAAAVAGIAPGTAAARSCPARIAYSRSIENLDEVSIFSVPPGGGAERRLTRNGIGDYDPAWAPSRCRLAYTSTVKSDPPRSVAIVGADGSHDHVVPNTNGGSDPDWSRSGRKLVFAGEIGSGSAIFTIRTDGSARRQLTRFDDFSEPSWSPKGDRIAYRSGRSLYTMRNDGSDKRLLATDASHVTWEPDAFRVAFEREGNVWVALANGSSQRRVTGGKPGGFAPAFSPDGSRIAFTRSDGSVWTMTRDGTDAHRVVPYGVRPDW